MMLLRARYHVAATATGHWVVERQQDHWRSDRFDTQDEAVRWARQVASAGQSAELVVHGDNGDVEAEYSYVRPPASGPHGSHTTPPSGCSPAGGW
jgi:hypothetical protein